MLDMATPDSDAAEIMARMMDPWWRLTSGMVYKILAKTERSSDEEGDDEGVGLEIPFRPNAMQMKLLNNLHNRNLILKARQLGLSTVIDVAALDTALFNPDQQVVVIAHTENDAIKLFRTKIKYAYDRLPLPLKALFPLKKETESSLIFAHNNSTIEVATSARGGTTQFLHVSEMGKIAAQFPAKARELTTGSLQSVPLDGLCFIESTAEGQEGAFFELAKRAEAKWRANKVLTPQDYRFHFFAWWENPEYCLTPEQTKHVAISPKDHEYFDGIEDVMGCSLRMGQRAWYVAKRDEEFAHEPTLMWREFPSTPDECWRSGIEGKYLAPAIATARAQGRIGKFPIRPGLPVNGFWDIGRSDTQTLWLHQSVVGMDHWVGYMEGNGLGFLPYLNWIDSLGVAVGGMYLPHDASQKQGGIEAPTSLVSQLRAAKPSWTWHVVPRVATIQHGIDLMRIDFATYCFDEEACKDGIRHLENYKRKWNKALACWDNEPEHDDASHAADALRQKAQGYTPSPAVAKAMGQQNPRRRSGLLA